MGSPAYTEQSLGKRGSKVINSADGATTGKFVSLVVGPGGATLSAITIANKDNASRLASISLPAGYTTYGNITSVTVSSGIVEVYNA